jgi:formylglycine-generating enzyme required for sulfatase activity
MNTEWFVQALSEYQLNPTEIADILWLALRQPPVSSTSTPPEDAPIIDVTAPITGSSNDLFSNTNTTTENQINQKTSDDNSFDIINQPPVGTLPPTALPIAVPDAGFLTEALPLIRALKPLLKRVNSTIVSRVNEAATVDRIAETDIWLPVMQADREPWFEVALIIDTSAGMTLWQRLIEDIQRLLRCYGSFRDLRVWELVDIDGKIGLKSGADRSIRSPKELLTSDGRRLTMVFSDCTADYWWNGTLQPVLASWGAAMPTVIWQVLPDWMWKRTALGAGEYVSIRNRIPGATNKELNPTFLSLRPSQRRPQRNMANSRSDLGVSLVPPICVPVISTDGDSIADWSCMLAGDRRQATPGFVLPASGWEKYRNRLVAESPAQRLEQFRLRATPHARRLAALLSAAPVITLPVMRLIRAAMLPESSPLPVAEVFLSGLLQRVSDQETTNNSELVQYDFPVATRDCLLDILPVVEAIEIIEAVSQHVAERLNFTLVDFRALLLSPDLRAEADRYGLRAFARVTAQILRKLGGDYVALADRFEHPQDPIEQNTEPVDFFLEDLEYEVAKFINFPPLQVCEYESAFIAAIQDRFDFETAKIERQSALLGLGVKWRIDRRPGVAWGYTESLLGDRVGLDMIAIPGGSFKMGDETQHNVMLQPFYLGRYSITQAQWRVVASYAQINKELDPEPFGFKDDNLPVETISWEDVQEFCQRLSTKTGKNYRLPSEVEWEYACRAGTVTPFHFGETITSELANYDGSETYNDGPKGGSRRKTTVVGTFPANDWGLHDMHGNVWEWCEDDWHGSYEGAPEDGSAWVDADRKGRKLLRGGSWNGFPGYCRSAFRGLNTRGFTSGDVGFRVCCEPPRILLK